MDERLVALARRCADGELDAAGRAELLARLRTDPAGFEPLALALLERRAIGDAARRYTRPEPPRPAPLPARRRWRSAAGMAATAALGLVAGLSLNRLSAPAGPVAPPVVAVAEPAADAGPAPPGPPAAPKPVGVLEWPTGDGPPLSLPVYDGRDVPSGYDRDPLPPGLREELIAAGRFGGELRQEYTFPLADGRLLSVPLHAVSVRGPEVF